MTIKLNGALGRCLAGAALGGAHRLRFRSAARPNGCRLWRAASRRDRTGSRGARLCLTAPLMRRPGVYLADVSAGPAGYQRLIIDARSGQVLERFPVRAECGDPRSPPATKSLASPKPGLDGRASAGFFRPARSSRCRRNQLTVVQRAVHIPAAISPYGPGDRRSE